MKSTLAVVVLGTASFAAAKPVASSNSGSATLEVRTTDGISSCGDQWMAIDNVKTNNNAVERQGYNAAVDQFCAKAAGQNVGKDKFLSQAIRVWLDYGGNPSTTGINGYVYFEVHNKKQSNGHTVDETTCKNNLKTLSATNSKCYGKDNRDTKGGTYQVGNEEVSYHALPKKFPPTLSTAVDKPVLQDAEITPLTNGGKGNTLSPFPTYSFNDVVPFPCHSHNDYERDAALYTALSTGCISVEADVWVQSSSKLTIAHTSNPGANGQTLPDLYLNPLKALLDANKGAIFPKKPDQGIYLLVDFKTKGPETWTALVENLKPLREAGYLSHYSPSTQQFVQRQVTVIASGNARVDISGSTPSPLPASLDATTNPDFAIFVDAVLDRDLRNFNKSNSFYASAKFSGGVDLGADTLAKVKEAKGKGLVVRYWDVPDGRDKWQKLVDQGVDRLDVAKLEEIAGVDFKV